MAEIWEAIELKFKSAQPYASPYTEVEFWAEFRHESGETLRRPGFWDGGQNWKLRFAPTRAGQWIWTTFANKKDQGITGKIGTLTADSQRAENPYKRHGLLRMSAGKRSATYADGTPFFLVADTAWALPWRATEEQCRTYAADRQRKGFNAALLMSVQPDMGAKGPANRTQYGGFDVGFKDLPSGHINELRPAYFRYLDKLIAILHQHHITPVLQPVFHGYGWKGLQVAGRVIPADEYARYCRYLVARYGAAPAIYLVGADGYGTDPGVRAGGREIEAWDCYKQPAGIHYNPMANNRSYQADAWLDFQWCQTGHSGEHRPDKVAAMWRNRPVKGVANGEPTYEAMNHPSNGAGWWQGHEAWSNLCAGGTMGVFYGAGSLWNWILDADEPGHATWCSAARANWRQALSFEGSNYPGVVGRLLEGLPFADMAPQEGWTIGKRCVGVAKKMALVYLEQGGGFALCSKEVPLHYRVCDASTGDVLTQATRKPDEMRINAPAGRPIAVVFHANE